MDDQDDYSVCFTYIRFTLADNRKILLIVQYPTRGKTKITEVEVYNRD